MGLFTSVGPFIFIGPFTCMGPLYIREAPGREVRRWYAPAVQISPQFIYCFKILLYELYFVADIESIFNHVPKAADFGRITQMAIAPFKVIQDNRFWYQAKARMQLPISY